MYSIGEFAKKIGVTIQTLRDWDKSGKLKPAYRSKGNYRYYSEDQLNEILQKRVSNSRLNGKRSHINKKIIKELEKWKKKK